MRENLSTVPYASPILGTSYSPLYFTSAAELVAYTQKPSVLVDACVVDHRFLKGMGSGIYTTQAVNSEISGGVAVLSLNTPLDTVSYRSFDFRPGIQSAVVTVTSPANLGTILSTVETVTAWRMGTGTSHQEFPSCAYCGKSTIVQVTTSTDSTGIYLCNTVVSRAGDFSLAVYAVASSNLFTLITNDGCLGTALRHYYSYSLSRGFWINYKK